MRLIICTAPRTKKNHGRILRFGKFNKVVPSAAFLEFQAEAVRQLAGQAHGIDHPVNCRAVFYREARRGDLVGYMQGLADVLEKAGVLADDKWIEGWDGTRLDLDRAAPRIEVELGPLTEEVPL